MSANTVARPEEQALFLDALKDLLPSLRRQTYEMIEKRAGKEAFEIVYQDLIGYIYNGAGDKLTRIEMYALLSQVLRSLGRYIEGMGIPVTLNTVMTHAHLLPYAVEQDFPGYADAKILKYIIQPARL